MDQSWLSEASYHFSLMPLQTFMPKPNSCHSLCQPLDDLALTFILLFSLIFPVPTQLLNSRPVAPNLVKHQNPLETLINRFEIITPGLLNTVSGVEHRFLFCFFNSLCEINIAISLHTSICYHVY